jgi:hypothetical protein
MYNRQLFTNYINIAPLLHRNCEINVLHKSDRQYILLPQKPWPIYNATRECRRTKLLISVNSITVETNTRQRGCLWYAQTHFCTCSTHTLILNRFTWKYHSPYYERWACVYVCTQNDCREPGHCLDFPVTNYGPRSVTTASLQRITTQRQTMQQRKSSTFVNNKTLGEWGVYCHNVQATLCCTTQWALSRAFL